MITILRKRANNPARSGRRLFSIVNVHGSMVVVVVVGGTVVVVGWVVVVLAIDVVVAGADVVVVDETVVVVGSVVVVVEEGVKTSAG